MALIVQGSKCAVIGEREYRYAQGQYCITGVDLPSAFYVQNPSEEKPFLAVVLDLDGGLALEMPPSSDREKDGCCGLSVGDADADLKQLRLYEAQRLMLLEDRNASRALTTVGYESETQFNREYKRLFGEPPHRVKLQRPVLLQ